MVTSEYCSTRSTAPRRRSRVWQCIIVLPLLLALAVACTRQSPSAPPPPADRTLDEAAAGITPGTVGAHVAWLAADERLGRRTPSPALAASADYIADVFAQAGLTPGGDGGSFLQRFPCDGVTGDDRPANVVAWRRGSDPALTSQWVVITAHYDGLGVRQPDARGDSIYNGADDDASGTAAVLEVARAFARVRAAPARSVAFVAMAGEENGLVGSWWFVGHRPAAMADIVANVNLDMVGRNAADQLYSFGEVWSSVGTVTRSVAQAHAELGFRLVALTNEDRGFERSDQFPFAWAGIPAVFLNTGTEAEYHRPTDEAARIDNDKLSRVARLTLHIAYELANQPDRPAWNATWQAALAGFSPIHGTCVKR